MYKKLIMKHNNEDIKLEEDGDRAEMVEEDDIGPILRMCKYTRTPGKIKSSTAELIPTAQFSHQSEVDQTRHHLRTSS